VILASGRVANSLNPKAGKPGVPVSLLLYMQTWMKEHLSKTDKLYSAFLNARGVR
jgi:hemerythrin